MGVTFVELDDGVLLNLETISQVMADEDGEGTWITFVDGDFMLIEPAYFDVKQRIERALEK